MKPTATQSEIEEHETPVSHSPLRVVSFVQVVPPFDVPTTELPATAVQSDVVGHETPLSPKVPEGTPWSVQVAPPSVVATTTASPPELPTAMQCETERHEIESRSLWIDDGTLWAVQVAPPFVVAMMAAPASPPPTAKQSEVEGHETPWTDEGIAG